MSASQYPLILTYHSISEGDSPLKISPALFAQQMAWLTASANTISFAELTDAVATRRALPERSVVLTFDDGFRDFYFNAAPVLQRLKIPAIVFLPSGYCGRTNSWPGQPPWVHAEELLSWKEIAELSGNGITFGAHTVNHPNLIALAASAAKDEIALGKLDIENQIGKPVEFFAYPYGRWNDAVRELVGQYYKGACATGAAVVAPNCDPLALPRVDANYVRRPAWFGRLFTPSFMAYLFARRAVRRLRGQPEGRVSHLRPVPRPAMNV